MSISVGEGSAAGSSAATSQISLGEVSMAYKTLMDKRFELWLAVPLNVAVIGQSGCGKSSFINAARGLASAEAQGAAPVGLTETTKIVTPYIHPEYSLLTFWDIPGGNTTLFPKETYLTQINFDQYDFYLILSCDRFKEDDVWLGDEIKRSGKSFYFVRTKVDVDIQNYRKDYPWKTKDMTDQDIFREVCRDADKKLANGSCNTDMFLIDSKTPAQYGFGDLLYHVLTSLPELKLQAFTHSVRTLFESNKSLITGKANPVIYSVEAESEFSLIIRMGAAHLGGNITSISRELNNKILTLQADLGVNHQSVASLAAACGANLEQLQATVTNCYPGQETKKYLALMEVEIAGKATAGQKSLSDFVLAPFLDISRGPKVMRASVISALKDIELSGLALNDLCLDIVMQHIQGTADYECSRMKALVIKACASRGGQNPIALQVPQAATPDRGPECTNQTAFTTQEPKQVRYMDRWANPKRDHPAGP